MPHCPGNGTVVVEAGDNLWSISKYVLVYEGNKNPTNTQIQNKSDQIARLNVIANKNLIYPGQVFKTCASTGSTTTNENSKNKSNAPVITSMGIQSGTDRKVFATWTWGKHDTTEEYEYEWYFDAGDSVEWHHGGDGSSGKRLNCTFDPPENAIRVKFMVRPIAMTKKEG